MTPAEKLAAWHNAEVQAKNAGAGSNSDPAGRVKSYVDRLFHLEEEKQAIADDIKELKVEAKENGVDPKALAAVVKRRREDAEKRVQRERHEAKVDDYLAACGLLD